MADITLPGAFNSQNDKKVESFLKVKQKPIDSLKDKINTQKNQLGYMQGANKDLADLREAVKVLYNYENPFSERLATSSNEAALEVNAGRGAKIGEHSLKIDQIAGYDNFISKQIPNDYKVAPGEYEFSVGDKTIKASFRGGSLKEFADLLNTKGKGILSMNVIKSGKDNQVLSVKAEKTGEENLLTFTNQNAIDMGLSTGILKSTQDIQIPIEESKLIAWMKPLSKDSYKIYKNDVSKENVLEVLSGGELSIALDNGVKLDKNYILEMDVKITPTPTEENKKLGIDFQLSKDKYNIRDITLENKESEIIELPLAKKDVKSDEYAFIYDSAKDTIIPLPKIDKVEFPPGGDFGKYKAEIQNSNNFLNQIRIKNENTNSKIEIKNILLYNANNDGSRSYEPVNAVSKAKNAIVDVSGVKVERDTNEINDLFEGVNLKLKKPTMENLVVNVNPNQKLIKDYLFQFVTSYNKAMQEMNILTGFSQSALSSKSNFSKTDLEKSLEGAYFKDDEAREAAVKRIGSFQGDMNLINLKNRFKETISNPYKTDLGMDFAFLKQMGIATDSSKGYTSSLSQNVLNGYLEINEETLDKAIAENSPYMEQLFGIDSDGDLVKDQGLAVELDKFLNGYLNTNGIMKNTIKGMQNKIDSDEQQVKNYQDNLAKEEKKFRSDLDKMDGAYRELDNAKRQLQQFGISNSNSGN